MKFLGLLVLLLITAATPLMAHAEARMEINPGRSRCVVPFEIMASGLPPSRDVLVDMVVDGVTTGAVGGRSEPDGRFYSPIPMVLIPCEAGGLVVANLRVDGQAIGLTATFEVTARNAPPAPPALGNTNAAATDEDDWMFVAAIGAGVLLLTLVVLLVGPRRDRKR